jgi:hypothetical protein
VQIHRTVSFVTLARIETRVLAQNKAQCGARLLQGASQV